MQFSDPVPHEEKDSDLGTVIMTRIKENKNVFVHASDIQLLNDESIRKILSWQPDIVLAGGPPLYLSILSKNQITKAWNNARQLAEQVEILILDHYLMRNLEGLKWIKKLSLDTKKTVLCAADFMKKKRILLEAKRKQLYKDIPVVENWHEKYAKGKVTTNHYWKLAKQKYL